MGKDATKKLVFMFGFLSLFCFAASCGEARAQMSPLEILQKADEARGNLEGIQWDISMDAVENGRKQQRNLRVIAKGYNSFIDTLAPSNVRGQKLLMQDRNMWFAKPGLSKPVPISPRQKLMGSASNGDIAATNYAGDYKIMKTEEVILNNEPCVMMDLQAIDSRATYDKIRYWISRERMVGLKAEFFTVSGKMFKTATFEYENSIAINNQPREFISKMVINSALIKDDVTVIKYSSPALKKVSDSVFNINLLTR